MSLKQRFIFTIFTCVVIVFLNITTFFVVGQGFHKTQIQKAEEQFASDAKYHIDLLLSALSHYEKVLNGLKAFFLSSNYVDAGEFESFSSVAMVHEYSIKAMFWIPKVERHEYAEFLQQAEKEGFEDFRIQDFEKGVNKQHAQYPILYSHPGQQTKQLEGKDLASHPEIYKAIQKAENTNAITTTTLIRLPGYSAESYVLINPVYKRGKITGFVAILFDQEDLKNASLGVMKDRFLLRVDHVFDKANSSFDRLNHQGDKHQSDNLSSFFKLTEAIDYYGKKWVFEISANRQDYFSKAFKYLYILFTLMAVFSAAIIFLLMRRCFLHKSSIILEKRYTNSHDALKKGYLNALKRNNISILKIDHETNKIEWLGGQWDLWHDDDEHVLPQTLDDFSHYISKQNWSFFLGFIDQAQKSEHSVSYDFLFAKGHVRKWFEVRLKYIAKDHISYVSLVDIDSRKSQDLEIKKIADIASGLPLPFFEVLPDLMIGYVSPSCSVAIPQLTIIQDMEEFFGENIVRRIQNSFSTGSEFSINKTIDENTHLKFFFHFLTHEEEVKCLVYVTDVTHHVAELDQCQKNTSNLDFILNQSPTLIVRLDQEGRAVYANPATAELTGYSRDSLISTDLWTLICPDEDFAQVETLKQLIQNRGEVLNYDMVLKTKSGKRRIVSWSSVNRWAGDDVIETILFGLDVTERNQFQAQLVEEKEKAEQVSRAKSEFLASMSHEIRTPMNGLIATASLLQDTKLSKDQTRYVGTMIESGDLLLNIINDILDFSKIEAGKMEILPVPFDVQKTTQSVFDAFEDLANNKGIFYSFAFDERLPQYLVGDQSRIRQIINNFLSNALKFTKKGFIELKIDLEDQLQDEAVIKFSVIDTGDGIPKDKQSILFDKFTQIDAEERPELSGTGLGLAICKSLVTSMNGEIGITSKEGRGSAFWFKIPLALANDNQITTIKKQLAATDHKNIRFKAKILLVEDVKTNQIIVGEMLKSIGIEYDSAYDGREGLEMALSDDYDLILMDWRMPNMDGIEATEEIRKAEKQDPDQAPRTIIALSAHAMQEYQRECLDAGMDDFLAKPLKKEDLISMLALWLPEHVLVEDQGDKNFEENEVVEEENVSLDIDETFLKQMQNNDPELASVFASTALDDLKIRMDQLEDAIPARDCELASGLAHAMKSMSADIGAKKFSAICRQLEQSSKDNQMDELDEIFVEMKAAYKDVLSFLEGYSHSI